MDHMSVGEVIAAIMAGLFALAFAAWAKRLDKALDLLEKIQAAMNRQAIKIERRLTILEQIAANCGYRVHHADDEEEE